MAALQTSIRASRGIFPEVRITRRTKDDLPKHVKGNAWWYHQSRDPQLTGYYIGEPSKNDVAVEFLSIGGNDSWYGLNKQTGTPTPKNDFWTTSSDRRVSIENEYGLGFWKPSEPQHPQYQQYLFRLQEEQEHLDKEEQAHKARSTKDEDSSDSGDAKTPEEIEVDPVGPPAPTEELEILSGGLHHIATLKGKQPLHERPPVILQTITHHSSQGGTVAIDVEPVAAQEPTRVQMSSQTASGSGQTQTQQTTAAAPNGGALLGSTPNIVSGK